MFIQNLLGSTAESTACVPKFAKDGRQPIAVNQPLGGGQNYPFVYETLLRELVADLYLYYTDPACRFKLPFRIAWIYGFDCRHADAPFFPVHSVDMEIVDATGKTVFDSREANAPTLSDWGDRLRVIQWVATDNQSILRAVQHTAWDTESTINVVGCGVPLPFYSYIEPQGDEATLDTRTCERVTGSVRSLRLDVGEEVYEKIRFASGHNFAFTLEQSESAGLRAGQEITLDASPGLGAGRFPGCGELAPFVRKINGVEADETGNLTLDATACYRIERPIQRVIDLAGGEIAVTNHALALRNDCKSCCTCQDFVNTYEGIRRLRDEYASLVNRINAVRDLHANNIARFESQRECRLANPLRVAIRPDCGDELLVAVGFCNHQPECVDNLITIISFEYADEAGDKEPGSNPPAPLAANTIYSGEFDPDVVCGSSFRAGNFEANPLRGFSRSLPAAYPLGGQYPHFYAIWDRIAPGDMATVMFRLAFPGGQSSDVVEAIIDTYRLPGQSSIPIGSGGGTSPIPGYEFGKGPLTAQAKSLRVIPTPRKVSSGLLGVNCCAEDDGSGEEEEEEEELFLPTVLLSGAGWVSNTGSGDLELPSLELAGEGTVNLILGAGALLLPAAGMDAAGFISIVGSGALELPAATAAGTGQTGVQGSGDLAMPVAMVVGTGEAITDGAGNLLIDEVTVAGAGWISSEGSGSLEIAAVALAGAGQLGVIGSSELTIAAVSVAGSGQTGVQGSGDLTMPAASLSGVGDLVIFGAGELATGEIEVSGSGQLGSQGSGMLDILPVEASGSGWIANVGTASLLFSEISVSGNGQTGVSADGQLAVAAAVAIGDGWIQTQGDASLQTPAVEIAGTMQTGSQGSGSIQLATVAVSGEGTYTDPEPEEHVVTFDSSTTWNSPANLANSGEILVECWGGGGGGGSPPPGVGAGGGGGGAYARKTLTVAASTGYTVNVGAAGAGGDGGLSAEDGFAGGSSYFIDSTTVRAAGGSGGLGTAASGGAGGQAASSLGDVTRSGGTGGNGRVVSPLDGGGGGASASSTSNGNSATGQPGATATSPDGGGGGQGGLVSGSIPDPGSSPGGGGGGATRFVADNVGASGAAGRVKITYYTLG